MSTAEDKLAAIKKLADQWNDMLDTEQEVMTEPQYKAWSYAYSQLHHIITSPMVGEIIFTGGRAEQYLGDSRWQRFREDERECDLMRYGIAHRGHEYKFFYTDDRTGRGIIKGHYWCDGLTRDQEPYPLCPVGIGKP